MVRLYRHLKHSSTQDLATFPVTRHLLIKRSCLAYQLDAWLQPCMYRLTTFYRIYFWDAMPDLGVYAWINMSSVLQIRSASPQLVHPNSPCPARLPSQKEPTTSHRN
jgi:hypothetical protein